MRALAIAFLLLTGCLAQEAAWRVQRVVALRSYPPLARQARIQGLVKLRCTLDAEGKVINVEPLQGHGLLANAASKNVAQWTFVRLTESTGSRTVELEYSFELREPARDYDDTQFTFEYPNRVRVLTSVGVINVNSAQ